jgi:hypothetical protein
VTETEKGFKLSSLSDVYAMISIMVMLGSGVAWGLKLEARIDAAVALSQHNHEVNAARIEALNDQVHECRQEVRDSRVHPN